MSYRAICPIFTKYPHRVALYRHACRVLATLGLLALAACATNAPGPAPVASPTTPEAKQALVAKRATSRWDLLIKDDLDAAYAYMSQGSRDTTSLEKFKLNFRRGAFRAAKIDTITCDGDACKVRLYVTYDHPKMKGITTPIVESWIIDGGQAWYVYGVL
jgi:hypothetical protein